jgi:alanyl-tRNA synthetase
VEATGQIGFFKITSEAAISAGIRRIEAITADKAEEYIYKQLNTLEEIGELLNNPKNLSKSVEKLVQDNAKLNKQVEELLQDKVKNLKQELINKIEDINGVNYIADIIEIESSGAMKDMAFQMKNEVDNLVLLMGANINGKANLSLMISEKLVEEKGLNASKIISEAAKEIKGGGGGQAFFATAGGKDPSQLQAALDKGKKLILEAME